MVGALPFCLSVRHFRPKLEFPSLSITPPNHALLFLPQQLEFFRNGEDPCEVLDGEDGVLFVHQADGRATGDAFVLFSNDVDAAKALAMHRHVIGTRYIELFKSTTAEVQQVRKINGYIFIF